MTSGRDGANNVAESIGLSEGVGWSQAGWPAVSLDNVIVGSSLQVGSTITEPGRVAGAGAWLVNVAEQPTIVHAHTTITPAATIQTFASRSLVIASSPRDRETNTPSATPTTQDVSEVRWDFSQPDYDLELSE
ncbi:MAG: hypothetical protein AAF086_04430 [Planctomycetota bacterium]